MPVARSKVLPQAVVPMALGAAAYDCWAPALASLSAFSLDKAPGLDRMAEQTHEATRAAVRHWRELTELQIRTANEAYRLAASHAESRRQALTQFMETLWPTSAGARPQEESANV